MKIDPVKVIPLEKLQQNTGQLAWLKRNPRQWTQTDIDRTKRSIDQDAELMQARPLLAVPGPDKDTFVVFGGNLRLTACRALEWPGAPVAVFHPDASELDREAIHRMALKDNGSFGSWNTDALANEWDFDEFQFQEFGLPEWVTGTPGSPSASKTGEMDPSQLSDTVTLKVDLKAEEFSYVKRKLGEMGETDREGLLNLLGYVEE